MEVVYKLREYWISVSIYNQETDPAKKKMILEGFISLEAYTTEDPLLRSLLTQFILRHERKAS